MSTLVFPKWRHARVSMAKAKGKGSEEPKGPKTIQNRRARFDYHILEDVEAGLVLAGAEVKSIFLGNANLTDAYCKFVNDELWVINLDVEPYKQSSHFTPERRRDRKLLLHRRELNVLERKSMEKGLSLLPLELYFKNGRVKLRIGLGRGKKDYDKRDQIAKNDTRREMDRIRKGHF